MSVPGVCPIIKKIIKSHRPAVTNKELPPTMGPNMASVGARVANRYPEAMSHCVNGALKAGRSSQPSNRTSATIVTLQRASVTMAPSPLYADAL
jgi:hypothetical protein